MLLDSCVGNAVIQPLPNGHASTQTCDVPWGSLPNKPRQLQRFIFLAPPKLSLSDSGDAQQNPQFHSIVWGQRWDLLPCDTTQRLKAWASVSWRLRLSLKRPPSYYRSTRGFLFRIRSVLSGLGPGYPNPQYVFRSVYVSIVG